jgi:hypothetical protein
MPRDRMGGAVYGMRTFEHPKGRLSHESTCRHRHDQPTFDPPSSHEKSFRQTAQRRLR